MNQPASSRPRIGFVYRYDARNIRSWSGTAYFMAQALQKHVGEVVYLGPDDTVLTRFIVHTSARVNRLAGFVSDRRPIGDHNRLLSKRLGSFFSGRIRENPCDILFAPAASVEIAHLQTNLPIVYLSDLTWANIVDYYPEFSSLSTLARAEGERTEAAAIQKASAIIYPSDWAVQTAVEHYHASPEKVFRIPFGANLQEVPPREAALNHKFEGTVKLLWVGVDWNRKGGNIAVSCLLSLLERGVDAELTVVGCTPPAESSHAKIRVVPFLNKGIPEQRNKLSQIFLESHFLLFPTRAEATAIVLCEASAHGLPTLVSNTGGVGGAIREGINGFLIPKDANGKEFADRILSTIGEPGNYQALVLSSRNEYESQLNWDHWGQSAGEVFRKVLSAPLG